MVKIEQDNNGLWNVSVLRAMPVKTGVPNL